MVIFQDIACNIAGYIPHCKWPPVDFRCLRRRHRQMGRAQVGLCQARLSSCAGSGRSQSAAMGGYATHARRAHSGQHSQIRVMVMKVCHSANGDADVLITSVRIP